MRHAVRVCALLAACVIFASPAAAQSLSTSPSRQPSDRWMFNAAVGPSFGTLGSTAAFDARAGYAISDRLSLIGEVGVLPHAPFTNGLGIAPSISPLTPDFKAHVNGYHVNGNLRFAPSVWNRIAPYATAGLGTFTGSTFVQTLTDGMPWKVQRERMTNFATNLGGGVEYRVNRWLGVNADYRHFIVATPNTEHVNRFTTGVSLFVR